MWNQDGTEEVSPRLL
jgi:hypothetical protein